MSIFSTDPKVRVNTKDRYAKLTWELGETNHHDGRSATAVAQLSVLHLKSGKLFAVSVYRANILPSDGAFSVETFTTFNGTLVRLTSRPVARYSEKAFREAIDAALAELRQKALQDDSEIAAVADPTSPA